MLLKGVTFIWLFFIPYDNITMIIIATIVNALVGFGFAPTLSMIGDSIDYQDEKTGVRSDGIAFATYGLSTKLGGAIGSSMGIMLMTAFGYVAGAAVDADGHQHHHQPGLRPPAPDRGRDPDAVLEALRQRRRRHP